MDAMKYGIIRICCDRVGIAKGRLCRREGDNVND